MPRPLTCGKIQQNFAETVTKYTISENEAFGFWPSTPDQPGNKFGGCRLRVPEPGHIQKESRLEDVRKSVIKELLDKKKEIELRSKTLRVPLAVFIECSMVPNILPTFLLNIVMKPLRMATYTMSNFKSLPVTIAFMGMPVHRVFAVPPFRPELFGNDPYY